MAAEPLSLSVHSLPNPGDPAVFDAERSGRWKLLAIILLCSMPLLVSYFVFFVLKPGGRAAIGELIHPARPVPSATAHRLDGTEVKLESLKGQWLLVAVAPGDCGGDCPRRLFLQRQLREMLGKDRDRVDRVWLISDAAQPPQALSTGLADATVLRVDPAAISSWFGPGGGQGAQTRLFVVDPLGNAMMQLPALFDSPSAAKARSDLDRLLRASASWDTPGRP